MSHHNHWTSIIPKDDENMHDSSGREDVMVRGVMVPPWHQSPSLGFALRELFGHLTSARHTCETQLAQFQQRCRRVGVDMSNQALRQREWTSWIRERFDPDMCPHLQNTIDQGRRQVAASYSWQYSPSQDVSGHFANVVRLLDVSCQALIVMIGQGMNDWDAFAKLELELRAAVGYANLSKEVNPGYFWS
ncbi:hypothetical protein LCI18_009407 [Fusarium solani-melongenae]|uniref:Uncharacterized protein n=1 Tax=Fusarium solani subsp. cucurbitae TaxID=2747967 RepID=A0ACD3ZBF8_FUSSC|nr:hypothetical protein LCI18_009407 [Fusarium solani-melongenae]